MKGILLNLDNDIMFSGHDFLIGDIVDQTVETIIVAHCGEFKEIPTLGFGASKILGGNIDPFWTGEIKQQLHMALIQTKNVTIDMKEGLKIELE